MLAIETTAFRKPSGEPCVHCREGVGCGIYETRFVPCREFQCGWRLLPIVPEAMRPDRSGILVVADEEDIPPDYQGMSAVKFIVSDPASLTRSDFLECLAGLIHARAPTFLAAIGPPGHFFAKAFLNTRLAAPVERRDGGALVRNLSAIYRQLAGGPFEPIG